MSKFIVFAGKEKNAGGIYDIYKMAETREEAINYFKEALFVENNKWSHIVSLVDLAVIMDSTKINIDKFKEDKKPVVDVPFKLPELELFKSENWVKNSLAKFRKSRDAKFVGFNIETNIVIPDNILIVGGYPERKEDFDKMREIGIDTFVCLNDEYGKTDKRKFYKPYAETDIYGSTFIHIPIADMSTTDDKTVMKLCRDLASRILGGNKLYVHCSGGHGRTGTIVCILLHMLYPGLTDDQIFNYVQFSHDQRIGYYGPGYFTSKLLDHDLGACFQNGQVPTPQTFEQRYQVKRLIAENRVYIEAKKNYDDDTYLQQQIGFEEWFELMKNYDVEEEKYQNDVVSVFGGGGQEIKK